MIPVLECRDLQAGYRGRPVVAGVDLTINAGDVVAVSGPNGAGKTTTLLAMCGALPVLGGEVLWDGRPTASPLHRRAKAGLSLVTDEGAVTKRLTVADNLRLAGVGVDAVLEIFPELEALLGRRTGLLSGGEQRMLALARALARQPRVLIVDELSQGLAPTVAHRLLWAVRATASREGMAVCLAEPRLGHPALVADWAYVMDRGRVVREGPTATLVVEAANSPTAWA